MNSLLIICNSIIQHIAAEKGFEDCVLVLLRHGCNVNIEGKQTKHHKFLCECAPACDVVSVFVSPDFNLPFADSDGNTPLWLSVITKHHKIFNLLYHCACISNPNTGGNLLCLAAKRNELSAMKDLLEHGLNIGAQNDEGLTALQISMAGNHDDMVRFLVMNGAKMEKVNLNEWATGKMAQKDFEEMVQKREIGYPISILKSPNIKQTKLVTEQGDIIKWDKRVGICPRVSVYRGNPMLRNPCSEAGKLISLPNNMDEFKKIIGMYKFFPLIDNEISQEPHIYSLIHFDRREVQS